MTNIVCMSGGYDSTVLYDYLKKDEHLDLKVYHAFYTKVEGGTYNLNEFKCLSQKFNNDIDYLAHFNLHLLGEDYIPNRNTLFVMDIIAKLYVGEPLNIYLGIIKNFPRYPDCTHEWLDALNSFLSIEFPNVKVLAPFIDLTKDDVFKLGCRLGVKLEDTFSCNFSDNGEPCGVCENCKWRAAHMYPSYFLKEGNEIGK